MYQDTFSERNQEATLWVGNLDSEVDEELLVELMLQAGPVMSVNMPRDKVTGAHQGFAFVEFRSEADADYAVKVMNMVRLIGNTLKINKATREEGETDIGANLFVGNLDPDVDEQLLYTTFSAFGQVVAAKVMYDETEGNSKGFGFVNYADFNSADNALKNMNGQYLCNRAVTVTFAYKKGESGPSGTRHGNLEERRLAALSAPTSSRVHTNFASTAPGVNLTPHAPAQLDKSQLTMPPFPMMHPGGMGIPMMGFRPMGNPMTQMGMMRPVMHPGVVPMPPMMMQPLPAPLPMPNPPTESKSNK